MEQKFMPCNNYVHGECNCTAKCRKFETEYKREERMRDVRVKRVLAHLNGSANTPFDWIVRIFIAFVVLLTICLLGWCL